MYAFLSWSLFLVGLVTGLDGLVERNEVIGVIGYLAACAGAAGIADVCCRECEQSY